MKDKKPKREFSKTLLVQESVLIWISTLCFLFLAFICVMNGFLGELPWLSTMIAFPWTAYGVSQAFYYRKSMKENTEGGIKYQSAQNDFNCGISTQDDFNEDQMM